MESLWARHLKHVKTPLSWGVFIIYGTLKCVTNEIGVASYVMPVDSILKAWQVVHVVRILAGLGFRVGKTVACTTRCGITRTCTDYSSKKPLMLVHAVHIPTRNIWNAEISAACTNTAKNLLE